jgi:Rrf2 family transcriptional regulator, iron-sulfur cluster assembly transcription factor
MQLSTRGRYAVMAMVDLAARTRCAKPPCPPVCLSEIAASQQLSLPYLEQLFGKLRRAGLVTSMRGPGGGYRLARPANEVPIAAIAAAVDEAIHATRCGVGEAGCMAGAGPDGTAGRCQTHDLWAELGRQIRLFLEGVTLADVIDGQVAGRAVKVSDISVLPVPAAPGGSGFAERAIHGGAVADDLAAAAAHDRPAVAAHDLPAVAAGHAAD